MTNPTQTPASSAHAATASRMIPLEAVAARLGRSVSWFYAKRRRLERDGFPRPHPIVGRYDAHAIEAYLDRHSGLTATEIKNELDLELGF